jgi:hypothetical protein
LAKYYPLFCGIYIAKEANIGALSVFGDPMIIIKEIIGKSTSKGAKLKTIISRIKQDIRSFVRGSFFHIKRDLNEEAKLWAKHAVDIRPRTLVKNGVQNNMVIP